MEYNTKTILLEIRCESADWIELIHTECNYDNFLSQYEHFIRKDGIFRSAKQLSAFKRRSCAMKILTKVEETAQLQKSQRSQRRCLIATLVNNVGMSLGKNMSNIS
jgi:hypothetical protein